MFETNEKIKCQKKNTGYKEAHGNLELKSVIETKTRWMAGQQNGEDRGKTEEAEVIGPEQRRENRLEERERSIGGLWDWDKNLLLLLQSQKEGKDSGAENIFE